MKYLITESKLEETITNYLYKLFDVDNVNSTNPYEYDEDTGEEWQDDNRVEFYLGNYMDDNTCFRWYDCEYFNPTRTEANICPTVSLEYEYENVLNGYFGESWKEPFRKWFIKNFGLPVKTVDN